jgi:pimeloyl-ACP methyl ester carboxylesterase
METERTVVFFSGTASDGRLLDRQRALPYRWITPDWVDPHEGESLPEYARRMAARVDWPARCVLGGVSFGGMVAAELAREVRPAGLVLIATTLSPRNIPSILRFGAMLGKAIPDGALRAAGGYSRPFLNIFRDFSDEEHAMFADMLARTPIMRLRRTVRMIFNWPGVDGLPFPRLWIQGAQDLVIPVRKVNPDVVIPGAGHLVNWTHADQVNEHIRRFVDGLM